MPFRPIDGIGGREPTMIHYSCDNLTPWLPDAPKHEGNKAVIHVTCSSGPYGSCPRKENTSADLCTECLEVLAGEIIDGHWRDGRLWSFNDLRRPGEVEDTSDGTPERRASLLGGRRKARAS